MVLDLDPQHGAPGSLVHPLACAALLPRSTLGTFSSRLVPRWREIRSVGNRTSARWGVTIPRVSGVAQAFRNGMRARLPLPGAYTVTNLTAFEQIATYTVVPL